LQLDVFTLIPHAFAWLTEQRPVAAVLGAPGAMAATRRRPAPPPPPPPPKVFVYGDSLVHEAAPYLPVAYGIPQLEGHTLGLPGGKFSVTDIFDTNTYAHDARGDFLNWAIVDAGAFDYAADAWGYSYGMAAEWNVDDWSARGGLFDLSRVPNTTELENDFSQFELVGELERRIALWDHGGKIKLLGFLNRGRMGAYKDAVALAALNQMPDQAAAPPFARVLAEMFSDDPRAAAIALPTKPLHLMYAEPAREYIERHGGQVRTGAAAKVVLNGDGSAVAGVRAGAETWPATRVISSVPWFALADLFDAVPPALKAVVDRASRMASSPIVTVNLWFDRRVLDLPFIGLPGRAMQWVFDKRLVLRDETSHLSLVSSGAAEILAETNDALIRRAHEELLDALPDVRDAKLVRATVVREPRATFSLAPGQPARPSTETGVTGFLLAGDWIDTGLPATIESAVRSGHMAAEHS